MIQTLLRKKHFLFCCFFIFLFGTTGGAEVRLADLSLSASELKVRVLLDRTDADSEWVFYSRGGFEIKGLPGKKIQTIFAKELHVKSRGNDLVCSWESCTAPVDKKPKAGKNRRARTCAGEYIIDSEHGIEFSPCNGKTTLGKYTYGGSFRAVRRDGKTLVINTIGLEDYVGCVINWESVPSWPTEANKAFAVVCRTYVVRKIMTGRSGDVGAHSTYDIRATNAHQTYKGLHTSYHLWDIVDATRGIVLVDAKTREVIDAMYDACCGGKIPALKRGIDSPKYRCLARRYPCHYCKKCRLYSWTVQYKHNDFIELLHDAVQRPIKQVHGVAGCSKDRAGSLESIRLRTNCGVVELTGSKFYSIFKDIKSLFCSLQKENSQFVIRGNGLGHGLGLCQWGSYHMVKQGASWKEVLRFYYPGTKLMRMRLS